MKKQWAEFLEANSASWSYGLVPSLVQFLDDVLKAGDQEMVEDTLEALATQGVTIDHEGNLCFIRDLWCR